MRPFSSIIMICVFVFAYAKSRFSHDEAHLERVKTSFTHVRQDQYCVECVNILYCVCFLINLVL